MSVSTGLETLSLMLYTPSFRPSAPTPAATLVSLQGTLNRTPLTMDFLPREISLFLSARLSLLLIPSKEFTGGRETVPQARIGHSGTKTGSALG